MRTLSLCTGLVAAAGVVVASGQAPAGPAVDRLDPALDSIISANASLEILKADYFGFTEGPVWVRDGGRGHLLFSDVAANTIYKWTPDGMVSPFLERAGYTGDLASAGQAGFLQTNGRLFVAILGPNGVTVDPLGRIVFCAHGDRAIIRLEKDGTRTTLAERFEGKRLNRPNDLVVKSNGAIYFTDPRPNNPTIELPTPSVFLLKDGKLQQLITDLAGPNGIALSADEKTLYVNDIPRRRIMKYDIRPDDTVTNGRLFIDMSADKAPGSPDGVKVDQSGNVYSTGPGGLWIMTPDGKHVGTIRLPEGPTNMAFGDADGRMLYITARKSIARIRLNTPGVIPGRSASAGSR